MLIIQLTYLSKRSPLPDPLFLAYPPVYILNESVVSLCADTQLLGCHTLSCDYRSIFQLAARERNTFKRFNTTKRTR